MEPNKYDSHSVVSDGERVTHQIKHPDGSQDVSIEVKRLNLTNRTPEDDIAERAIIEAMSKKLVLVVIIHKPTNQSLAFKCPLTQVRIRAESAIENHVKTSARLIDNPKFGDYQSSNYAIVEIDGETVKVSTLQ